MMNFKEIQELVRLINKSNISEFKIKEGEFKLHIRTNQHGDAALVQPMNTAVISTSLPPTNFAPQIPLAPMSSPLPSIVESSSSEAMFIKREVLKDTKGLLEIKSPIVGTFYRSQSPEKPPYIKVGDIVEVGKVICIIEAMKLFNEIESEVKGKVVKVMLEDASPVEYEQVLFLIDPQG